jgi:hypothetical protein
VAIAEKHPVHDGEAGAGGGIGPGAGAGAGPGGFAGQAAWRVRFNALARASAGIGAVTTVVRLAVGRYTVV